MSAPSQVRRPQHQPETDALRAELDQLRLELAKERELSNALRLGFFGGIREIPQPHELEPPPLRYQLVDRANGFIKRYLEPIHRGAKGALALLGDRSQK